MIQRGHDEDGWSGVLKWRSYCRDRDLWAWLSELAPHRGRIQLAADAVVWMVAIYTAVILRFDFDLGRADHSRLWTAVAIAVVTQAVIGFSIGLYRQRWRFGRFEEMAAVMASIVAVGTVLLLLSRLAFSPRLIPDSVAVGAPIVAVSGMGAVRYMWRLFIDRMRRPSADTSIRVIVFGAGEAGEQLLRAIMRNPASPMFPVGLLDDDPATHRLRIRGVGVLGGREKLAEVAAECSAERLVIAVPSGDAELYRDLSQRAMAAGLDVAVLPSVQELLRGPVGVSDVRPLDVRDLLGRHEIQTDLEQIAGYITDHRVLVTGAGGSIGSELCRQLKRWAPAELIMLDRDESALHALQLQLEGRALLDSPNLVVGNIRDRERMEQVFAEHRPDVVFHAAALKHLPLLEMHPDEGYKTNVAGTLNLLEIAASHGVERFVNVSTDKAADPTSVLGHTKRVAERLTAHVATQTEGTFLSVRFGNVLGSRGSVLETFRAQIEQGGPVTVVHPDVTRYFMTVEEAVQLVIQAGAIGNDGEALVLDMGTPVRIDDVARQLIAHSDRPIKVEYTGLRHGEKMQEVLFSADEIGSPGGHPMISHVAVPPLSPAEATRDASVG